MCPLWFIFPFVEKLCLQYNHTFKAEFLTGMLLNRVENHSSPTEPKTLPKEKLYGLYMSAGLFIIIAIYFFSPGLGKFWDGRSEEFQEELKELHIDHLKKFTVMEKRVVPHVTRSTVIWQRTEGMSSVLKIAKSYHSCGKSSLPFTCPFQCHQNRGLSESQKPLLISSQVPCTSPPWMSVTPQVWPGWEHGTGMCFLYHKC